MSQYSTGAIDFASLMGPVARYLWGEPSSVTKSELRWGRNGSRSVNLDKGVWYDHERQEGGSLLELIKRETGVNGSSGVQWLKDHGFVAPDPVKAKPKVVKTWAYLDEHGQVRFWVKRLHYPLEPHEKKPRKKFLQCRPAADGSTIWNMDGVERLPYRLPEVMRAIKLGQVVFVVEGEKCADALWLNGIPATCNPGGAGKWGSELQRWFKTARLVLLPDNDEPGREHVFRVAKELSS